MDAAWMRYINWALSACPRLYRYARAVLGYLVAVASRSPPKSDTEDVKKMQAFLVATVAVLAKMKTCGAPQALIDAALAESVMLVQLQLEAMQLRQQLTVAALREQLGPDPAMPARATAVLAVTPGDGPAAGRATHAAFAPAAAPGQPAVAVRAASYSGAERRKRC